jgi:hypothetical protein
MNALPYKMTEEVIRQRIEVVFRQDKRWFVNFSSPPAGPWKEVKFFSDGREVTFYAYKKKEQRPNLILQKVSGEVLIIIVEVKESIEKMFPEIGKILATFLKEMQKIKELIKHNTPILCGFSFGTSETKLLEDLKLLNELLENKISSPYNFINNYVAFGVFPKNLDLLIKAYIKVDDLHLKKLITNALPKDIIILEKSLRSLK